MVAANSESCVCVVQIADKLRFALLRSYFLLVQWAPWFEKLVSSLVIYIFSALAEPTREQRAENTARDMTGETALPSVASPRQCPFSGVVLDMKKSDAGVGMTAPFDVDVFGAWGKSARDARKFRFRLSLLIMFLYFCLLGAAVGAFVYFCLIPFVYTVQMYVLTGRP